MTEEPYIGDGVYCEYDGYHLILSTKDNTGSNTIYLDEYVRENLKKILEPIEKENK